MAGVEQLAVIRNVNCGVGDRGRFALWFTTYIKECVAALQVFEDPVEIAKVVESAGVSSVFDLKNKTCWVLVEDHRMQFLRIFKE